MHKNPFTQTMELSQLFLLDEKRFSAIFSMESKTGPVIQIDPLSFAGQEVPVKR